MSDITSVYNALTSKVQTLLPNHLRLSDPYRFLKNTDSEKRQGWGVKILAGENTQQSTSCGVIVRQEMSVVLTRLVSANETASTAKGLVEVLLLEDFKTVWHGIESDVQLSSPDIIDSAFLDHGGVEFVAAQRDDILKIEGRFSFRYREALP